MLFLVADTQLYKRLCPSVGPSIGPSVRPSVRPLVRQHESKSGKASVLEAFRVCLSWKGSWVGPWVWMGVGCPCPPVRNDIVTPRHLFTPFCLGNFFFLPADFFFLFFYFLLR